MSREPETQETFDDSFPIGDRDAEGIALEIEETMGPVRRAAGDFVRALFMKHGYFNGRAESFVDHEDDWITCRVVVSCYGLPMANEPLPFEVFEFVCNVLQTPLGIRPDWGPQSAEFVERKKISQRYEDLKQKHPGWTFTECSLMARSEWLRDWLYENYRRGRKVGEE